jgi:hypothetical protein
MRSGTAGHVGVGLSTVSVDDWQRFELNDGPLPEQLKEYENS